SARGAPSPVSYSMGSSSQVSALTRTDGATSPYHRRPQPQAPAQPVLKTRTVQASTVIRAEQAPPLAAASPARKAAPPPASPGYSLTTSHRRFPIPSSPVSQGRNLSGSSRQLRLGAASGMRFEPAARPLPPSSTPKASGATTPLPSAPPALLGSSRVLLQRTPDPLQGTTRGGPKEWTPVLGGNARDELQVRRAPTPVRAAPAQVGEVPAWARSYNTISNSNDNNSNNSNNNHHSVSSVEQSVTTTITNYNYYSASSAAAAEAVAEALLASPPARTTATTTTATASPTTATASPKVQTLPELLASPLPEVLPSPENKQQQPQQQQQHQRQQQPSPELYWAMSAERHPSETEGERSHIEFCLELLGKAIAQYGDVERYGEQLGMQTLVQKLQAAEYAEESKAAESQLLCRSLEALLKREARTGSENIFVEPNWILSGGFKKLVKLTLWYEECEHKFSVCWGWDMKLETRSRA
ncbi:unnamed protein product, partial [Polarella glacialis]